MRILITGISGFVGSFLTEYLLNNKDNIQVAGTIYSENDLKNIEHLKDNLDLFKCDIRDYEKVNKIILEYKPDQIYHLAGIAETTEKDKQKLYDINVGGTLNILESCKKIEHNFKILLVSTGYVYGSLKDDKEQSFTEDSEIKPIGMYAKSKYKMEKKAQKYFDLENIEIIISRSFNHTGPRQTTEFVIPAFCEQIAKIEKEKLGSVISVGNLETIRDFTDVRDVVRAYILLMEKGVSEETYNVASDQGCSIQEKLDKILTLSDKEIKIEKDLNRIRKSDLEISIGSFEKINRQCGWKPEISINKTLKDTINYWRNLN
ncbi:MAG: GDP-mannose 4,6-dehydratase [Parcubacteria group bacterium]|nr:GDP-mannose 4,6-dehydratase [Parcubacteria group bacterium]